MLGAPHVASPLFNKGLSCRAARLCAKGKGASLSLYPSPSCSFLPAPLTRECLQIAIPLSTGMEMWSKFIRRAPATRTHVCVFVCVYIGKA